VEMLGIEIDLEMVTIRCKFAGYLNSKNQSIKKYCDQNTVEKLA